MYIDIACKLFAIFFRVSKEEFKDNFKLRLLLSILVIYFADQIVAANASM